MALPNTFLIDFIHSYKLRIECMLLKEEFTANLSYLEPSINAMLYAGEGNDRSKCTVGCELQIPFIPTQT